MIFNVLPLKNERRYLERFLMILKVKCVECGREGRVLVLFRRIFSRKWWFFGKIRLTLTKGEVIEYWECNSCREQQ